MKEEDLKQVKEIMCQVLDERDEARVAIRIDPETHQLHHDHYAIDLKERIVKKERYEAVRRQVMGWGIAGILSSIGYAFYNFFIGWRGS